MPFYPYRSKDPDNSCGHCKEEFEMFQKITSEALIECPECKAPIVRLIHGAPTIENRSTKKILSDENLKKHGFKKLVNTGGKYEDVLK